MGEILHKIKQRLYVKPCPGCPDRSPHDSHLTHFGRQHYARRKPAAAVRPDDASRPEHL